MQKEPDPGQLEAPGVQRPAAGLLERTVVLPRRTHTFNPAEVACHGTCLAHTRDHDLKNLRITSRKYIMTRSIDCSRRLRR